MSQTGALGRKKSVLPRFGGLGPGLRRRPARPAAAGRAAPARLLGGLRGGEGRRPGEAMGKVASVPGRALTLLLGFWTFFCFCLGPFWTLALLFK